MKPPTFSGILALPTTGYRASPAWIVTSPHGRLAVRVHDAATQTVEHFSNYHAAELAGRNYPKRDEDRHEPTTVNGVRYHWSLTIRAHETPAQWNLYASREGAIGQDATPAARKALRKLGAAALAYVLEQVPDALQRGQALSDADDMARAWTEWKKAQEAAEAAEAAFLAARDASHASAASVPDLAELIKTRRTQE